MPAHMASLRPLTLELWSDCVALSVNEEQRRFVATNAKSLDEAKLNPTLLPLAIFDAAERGWNSPRTPMVGFAMLEVTCSVGFILRVMIDHRYQRLGYGRSALRELIRRLRLMPDVEMIATSHAAGNEAMSRLLAKEGFVP